MVSLLMNRIVGESDPVMRTMLKNLLGDVIRELEAGYTPIKPQSGQLVLPGFEQFFGYSMVP